MMRHPPSHANLPSARRRRLAPGASPRLHGRGVVRQPGGYPGCADVGAAAGGAGPLGCRRAAAVHRRDLVPRRRLAGRRVPAGHDAAPERVDRRPSGGGGQRALAGAGRARRAPGILLGVVLRTVLGVPIMGGLVASLRWLTHRRRETVRARRPHSVPRESA